MDFPTGDVGAARLWGALCLVRAGELERNSREEQEIPVEETTVKLGAMQCVSKICTSETHQVKPSSSKLCSINARSSQEPALPENPKHFNSAAE